LSTPCFPHRPRHSKRSFRTFVVLATLLVAAVVLAAGVANVAQGGSDETSSPTKPTRLRLVGATSTSVTLTWRRSFDNEGVAGYEIYVSGGGTFRTPQTTYTITPLVCATTYRVGVAAYDAGGNK
jgi:hypothetical protein